MSRESRWRRFGRAVREVLTPPSRLELRIARRYLQGRRASGVASLNTVISIGGVAVGVMALIVVLGVMNGLGDDLRDRILVASPHLRVLTYGNGLRLDDWRRVAEEVAQDPAVEAVAPEVLTQSIISAGADYYEGVQVLGYAPGLDGAPATSLPGAMTNGDLSLRTDRKDVDGALVLGRRLAERIGVVPGDEVTLVSPAGSKMNRAIGAAVPRYYVFEVTGLFETGMFLYDDKFVVMDLEVAQRFAGLGTAVSGLAVRLQDPWEAPAVGLRLEDELGYPYRSLDWQSQNSTLFGALKLEKLAMGLIIFVIMIVAAFNIVGTLTMVVNEKTREIGILEAMGMPGPSIGRIFLAQGAIIGAVGVAIGLALGMFVALAVDRWQWIKIDPAVYFIDHLPIHVAILDVTVVVTASLLLAIVATLYPSRSAAALAPVDAIRHE